MEKKFMCSISTPSSENQELVFKVVAEFGAQTFVIRNGNTFFLLLESKIAEAQKEMQRRNLDQQIIKVV